MNNFVHRCNTFHVNEDIFLFDTGYPDYVASKEKKNEL